MAKACSFQDGLSRNERAREAFGGVPGLEPVLGILLWDRWMKKGDRKKGRREGGRKGEEEK